MIAPRKTLTAIFVAATLALGACGSPGGLGADDAPPSTPPSPPSAAPAASPSPAVASPTPTLTASPTPTDVPSATASPTVPATASVTWAGDPAEFGTGRLQVLKDAATASGLALPTLGVDTLKESATVNCGNATWKGNDPTIPIYVWCKTNAKILVVIVPVQAAQSAKGFDYAVAFLFDFGQAITYAKTGGKQSPALHGCITGVILKGLAAISGQGFDVGGDFVDRVLALYANDANTPADFKRMVQTGYAQGGSACPTS